MKKVAVDTVKTFIKEQNIDDPIVLNFPVNDSQFEVKLHTKLTMAEKSVFVNRVVSGCFDPSGEYRPEYAKPMVHATVLQVCTNLPVLTLRGERDESGAALMDLDAMDSLYNALQLDEFDNECYQSMLRDMNRVCGLAIDWKKTSGLNKSKLENSVRKLLDALTKIASDTNVSELLQYTEQISSMAHLPKGSVAPSEFQLLSMRKNQKREEP